MQLNDLPDKNLKNRSYISFSFFFLKKQLIKI